MPSNAGRLGSSRGLRRCRRRAVRNPDPIVAQGSGGIGVVAVIGFASVVWFLSYQGWVPALQFMPPASRDDPGRVAAMVVAHLFYGAALGGTLSGLRQNLEIGR
jgi:hypothetical protein